jgi:riboflavin kinase/FMN adenylyltransferase
LKVYYSVEEFPGAIRPVVTTGTFDGVHKGHLTILERLRERAFEVQGETVLLTFSPHPRMVLFPNDHGLRLLNDREEQIERLAKSGIDHLIIHPFDTQFAAIPALDYAREILVEGIGVHLMVVGYDHRFGKNREGDFTALSEFGEMFGFDVEEISPLAISEMNVSSTKTRRALALGDVALANTYLGYNYPLSGIVIEGDGIGRSLGFPTANLHLSNPLKLTPANGAYAVRVEIEGRRYKGMLNIGIRPTVSGSGEQRIEVHVFDQQLDLYGKHLRVEFVARLRDERKFDSEDALRKQLTSDRSAALALLQ